MTWIKAEYDDPLWYKMLANLILVFQVTIETIIPVALGHAVIIFLLALLLWSIATACGWDTKSLKERQDLLREELAHELAERDEGKAGSGYSEKYNELERLTIEMESIQEMMRERIGKLDTLAARQKGE